MTARSVLASAMLGESPPSMPVRRLIRLAALFGINENQARVALSRMVARGEATADRSGTYELAGHLASRAARLTEARLGTTASFDGAWHVVVVTTSGDDARTRRARRAALHASRLGELRDGVWVRPANLPLILGTDLATSATVFRAAPSEDPFFLAATVFDLDGWSRRAEKLCLELDATTLEGDDALAVGFVKDAEVVRHLQRDPLLPAALLPVGWPGPALRARFDLFDMSYRKLLAAAHRRATTASALQR